MMTVYILIAFFFIFTLLLSIKKSRHRRNVIKSKKIIKKINTFNYSGQKINYLRKVDPFVFEELILSAFEKKGFEILRNKKYTGDGGIDGTIYDIQNNKYLIQAKRYSNHINLAHIKEFGALLQENKCKGFFIHTGKTGKQSLKESYNYNMTIISGNKLIELIKA